MKQDGFLNVTSDLEQNRGNAGSNNPALGAFLQVLDVQAHKEHIADLTGKSGNNSLTISE
jgi:hypothetical protein